MAVDGSHLYRATVNGTTVEANLDGTSPQTISTGHNNPLRVGCRPVGRSGLAALTRYPATCAR